MNLTGTTARKSVLAVVGGALVGCSLPPVAPWPLGIAGFGCILAALGGRSWKGRLGSGALAGIGQFSIGLAWALQFNKAGYIALVIVESAIVAIAAVLLPPRGALRLPAAAGILTLAEWFRDSWPFGGLPLGSAALGQTGGPLQFAARLGGPLLVVFAAVLAGGGCADLVIGMWHRMRARDGARSAEAEGDPMAYDRRGATWRAGAALLAAAALGGGGAVSVTATPKGPALRVAIVQGGGRRGLTALQVPPSEVYDAAVRETTHVRGRNQLILWPEDVVAMGSTPFGHSAIEAQLAAIARAHRSTLVVGVTQDVGTSRFLNEVVALSPEGRIQATFEKVHRVPFGEYVPDRGFFSHFANLSAVPRDAIPGTGSGMIRTSAGRFAVLISYEVFFADRGRSGVGAGGRVILVPTNTSSYSNGQAPAQEVAASRLQAIEEDRYVLQAAPTGYSAVVAPSGAVLQRTALSVPAILETHVFPLTSRTPYEIAGELPILIGSLLLVIAGWALAGAPNPSSRRRRSRR